MAEFIRDCALDVEFFPFKVVGVVDVAHIPVEVTPDGVWCRVELTEAGAPREDAE